MKSWARDWYCVKLSDEARYWNKIERIGLRKRPYHYLTEKVMPRQQTSLRACPTSWQESSWYKHGMRKLRRSQSPYIDYTQYGILNTVDVIAYTSTSRDKICSLLARPSIPSPDRSIPPLASASAICISVDNTAATLKRLLKTHFLIVVLLLVNFITPHRCMYI